MGEMNPEEMEFFDSTMDSEIGVGGDFIIVRS